MSDKTEKSETSVRVFVVGDELRKEHEELNSKSILLLSVTIAITAIAIITMIASIALFEKSL